MKGSTQTWGLQLYIIDYVQKVVQIPYIARIRACNTFPCKYLVSKNVLSTSQYICGCQVYISSKMWHKNKLLRANCGVTYGSWIICHGLIRYGTHSCQVRHTQFSSTAHTVVKYEKHKHVTYVVMSMTGHGLYLYRVQTCHVQGCVRSYTTNNA